MPIVIRNRVVTFQEVPLDGLFERHYSWNGNAVTYRKVTPVVQDGKNVNSIFVTGRRSPDRNQNSWMDDNQRVFVE